MTDHVEVSAPGKLMLLGEHAVVYNRPCLATAVDQRMFTSLTPLNDPAFLIDAPDVAISNYSKPLSELGQGEIPRGAQFVEVAIANFMAAHPFDMGLKISTRSEFSSQFGFGSSSASTVCVIKALSEITGANLDNRQIFDLSYKTILDIQGTGSGFDIAAAIYGGALYFITGGRSIEPIEVNNLPLVVGYSGIKADTVTLIKDVADKFAGKPTELDSIYDQIAGLVNRARNALIKGDFQSIGDLMNHNQRLLAELGVSIPKLDQMIQAALENGAYGAKLSGAGGGDCMIALVPEDKKQAVANAINQAGGQVLNVSTNAPGVRIEL